MFSKKYLLYSFIALLSLGFTSCTGDDEPVDPLLLDNPGNVGGSTPPNQNSIFKAQIDGQQFVANQAIAGYSNAGGENLSTISITGVKTSNLESISLLVIGDEAGTYPLDFVGSIIIYNSSTPQNMLGSFSSSALESPISGSITITTLDLVNNKVSGTFEGTVYNFDEDQSKVITNGEFTNVTLSIP